MLSFPIRRFCACAGCNFALFYCQQTKSDDPVGRRLFRLDGKRVFRLIGYFHRRPLAAVLLASAMTFALSASAAVAPKTETPKDVGSQPGNYLAALVASAESDTASAEDFYRKALELDPRNLDLLQRAFVAALSNGDQTAANELGERLFARDPNNNVVRLATGVHLIDQGDYLGARARLLPNLRARDVTTLFLGAWTYAGQADLKHALGLLDQVREPALTPFRDYHAGLIADQLGAPAEAKHRLQAAFEASKSTLRFAEAYARFLASHGDVAGARAVYADFSRVVPHHPTVEQAIAALDAGRTPEPLIRNAKDGAAEVLYGLGGEGTRQGGEELPALIYLRLSLFLRPADDLTAITLANLLDRLKQGDAAIAAYESVPASSPLKPDADIQVALELDSVGKGPEARTRLAKMVSERPHDVDALSAYAGLLRMDKRYGEAAALYDQAIAAVGIPQSENWPLFYFRGICYERDKQWPKAEADFKKALELRPDQPQVLNYLGYSWVDKGMNLDQAFKMLQRAVDLRPNDGYIVDSLGWAHYKLGQYQQAADTLERAVNLKPSDPVLNDHLGDAYWQVNRRNEAHFQWNHARDSSPEADDLPTILKKIDSGLPDTLPSHAGDAPPEKKGG